jgi:hypothetical protein
MKSRRPLLVVLPLLTIGAAALSRFAAQKNPSGGPRSIMSAVIQTTQATLMTAPGTNMSNVR